MSRRPAGGRGHRGPGAVRVVSGTAGGRLIQLPEGITTRPTSDRVRQAVFNALDSLDVVEGARVLDAFAGSGALGIEALSRGAAHATFADTSPAAVAVVRANLAALAMERSAAVVAGPASRAMAAHGPFDLVVLDPPYAYDGWDELLVEAAACTADDGLVVIESDRLVPLPEALRGVRSKTYGGTVVQFAARSGAST